MALCEEKFHTDLVMDLRIRHEGMQWPSYRSNQCIPEGSHPWTHVKRLSSAGYEDADYVSKVSESFRRLEAFSVWMGKPMTRLGLRQPHGSEWGPSRPLFPNLRYLQIRLVNREYRTWSNAVTRRHFPKLVELNLITKQAVGEVPIACIPETVQFLLLDTGMNLSDARHFYKQCVISLLRVRMVRCVIKKKTDERYTMNAAQLNKIRRWMSKYKTGNKFLPDFILLKHSIHYDWLGQKKQNWRDNIDGVWMNGMFAPILGNSCAAFAANRIFVRGSAEWEQLAKKRCAEALAAGK